MSDPQYTELLNYTLSAYMPDEIITVSEWADKYRYLSGVSSSEPGRWRTDRTPYSKEIMDKLSSNDPTEEVVFMKGAQIGATELGFNWIGYMVDISPGPMLMVQPTEEMCKRSSKTRFDTMVEATKRLSEKIKQKRSRDSGNTMLQKDFPGGTIIMTGANSGTGLRSMPVKYLFLDEVDAYPLDIDGEGSPVSLAEARTRTFSRRKIFKCSTPTTSGMSAIEREFAETDQRYYEVPCPHCGAYQRLEWSGIKWQEELANTGKKFDVWYECNACGDKIRNHHKTRMLQHGHWVAYKPENSSYKKAGYHLSSLYSPVGWFSWEDTVIKWLESYKDPTKLKSFVNTILGETWTDKGEAPEWETVYDKRENYKFNVPPADVCFITAGVDVQKDRLELEIVGWCKDKVSYSLDYRVIEGDTSAEGVWNKLALVVNEQWIREDDVVLPLRMMAVDSGYNTSQVYAFCRRFDVSKVIPVKGRDNQDVITKASQYLDTTIKGKHTKVRVWNVGSSVLKSELYGYLKQRIDELGVAPPGYCHFPQYGHDHFKGLCSESLQRKEVKKRFVYTWVKHYDRNEQLDCRNYARAAASVVGIDRFTDETWKAMKFGSGIKAKPKPLPEKKKQSNFWGK